MLWILVDVLSQLFFVCSPSGRLPQQGLSLPVSGNLWPVLSLESVESTETQEHGVQCQLDIPGSLILRKDGDIVLHPNADELKKAVENSTTVHKYQRTVYTLVPGIKHFLPSCLFLWNKTNIKTMFKMKGNDEHSLILRTT